MKKLLLILLPMIVSCCAVPAAEAAVLPLRVLYIGHRPGEFAPLLQAHFAKVETVALNQFQPLQAAAFDVVLLATERDNAQAWFAFERPWIHPNPENRLEIDVEAKALNVLFDSPEFFPKTIAALREETTKAEAASVLARYAPEGPGVDADADAWDKWWHDNSPYLFYSELGGYRWYVDPLAKKRGVPSKDLRGPLRAD